MIHPKLLRLTLFNGSMGTIHDIIWAEGADYQQDSPLALLVDFDDYDQDAPSLVTDPESGHVLVPIFFVKRNWNKGTVHCTRTQSPLTIAYALLFTRVRVSLSTVLFLIPVRSRASR
jgi:ATP-dependent DNA helicase PIF1